MCGVPQFLVIHIRNAMNEILNLDGISYFWNVFTHIFQTYDGYSALHNPCIWMEKSCAWNVNPSTLKILFQIQGIWSFKCGVLGNRHKSFGAGPKLRKDSQHYIVYTEDSHSTFRIHPFKYIECWGDVSVISLVITNISIKGCALKCVY